MSWEQNPIAPHVIQRADDGKYVATCTDVKTAERILQLAESHAELLRHAKSLLDLFRDQDGAVYPKSNPLIHMITRAEKARK